ncbi:MAG: polyphosphate kinase 1 [Bacteroidales bacterium]|nr:polyphosphate kinase 1 [Bacteroidales bacterium]
MKKTFPIINREISWLKFNERVLQEANDTSLPILERLKFLGIYSNNLDEFYRVRVATLTRMADIKKNSKQELGFSPKKILNDIYFHENKMQKKFSDIYVQILSELEKENIFIINETQLCKQHSLFVKNYFRNTVRTNLFPLMLKNITDLDLLKDKSVYLAVCMQKNKNPKNKNYAIVKVPVSSISRFLVLPTLNEKQYVILLDDVLRHCMGEIFNIFDFDTYSAFTIKFSRDAELDIDNDVDKSFLDKITDSLKQRKRGKPVRFVYDRQMPEEMLDIILKKLKVKKRDTIVAGDRYHNFKDFIDFPDLGKPNLYFKKLPPLLHPILKESRSIFKIIKKKDVMLNFPYHSFSHIIDLLREASIDPHVKSIKMTIYRVAKNSNVINALINAARNGKKVTVFLELLARFDEEANIFWSKVMGEEGVTVLHGEKELKVHSKLILIKRIEKTKTVLYANIGTGNFNENTSMIYSDNSLLTSNPLITHEVDKVFRLFENAKKYKINIITTINNRSSNFKNLIVSPFNSRGIFSQLINNEIINAKKGKKAQIILKLNSLVDEQLVHLLYQASAQGVDVKIISRGICVLVPGTEKYNKNIEAISIVDRFLEHSRIYYFYNGGDEQFFISSADFMTRNIDHRIEVTCPIYDENIKNELRDIIKIQLKDNVKARILGDVYCNQYKVIPQAKPFQSQLETYKYYKRKSDAFS